MVCEQLDARQHITLGFERITALLDVLGNPEKDLRVIQVVGTNGKGTTAIALAAALEELGETAGVYLSPHVLSYTERVMLRGRYVTEDEFARAMSRTIRAADENGIDASQFELLTSGALLMFREAGISFAVLEAGLGARHDATSAAAAEVVVLTNITLDHMEYLGDTVDEIAREKLASLNSGATLVLGEPDLMEISYRECNRAGATLVEAYEGWRGKTVQGLAPYALGNVALGIFAAETAVGHVLGVGARERVARRVRGALPGRFEVYELHGVPVVVDGGHNPAGVRASVAAVRSTFEDRPLAVVFGGLRDKDIGSMLTALTKEADLLVLTRAANERAADPDLVLREHDVRDSGGRPGRVIENPKLALNVAVNEARASGGVVLATGSLYLAAAVLGVLREE